MRTITRTLLLSLVAGSALSAQAVESLHLEVESKEVTSEAFEVAILVEGSSDDPWTPGAHFAF